MRPTWPLLLVSLLLPVVGHAKEPPRIQGRTFAEWVNAVWVERGVQRVRPAQLLAKFGPRDAEGGVHQPADVARHVPVLLEALGDPNPRTRAAIVEVLGKMGAAAGPATPRLVELLQHPPSRALQREAALALTRIGPGAAAATPALADCLRSGDAQLRQAAATALGRIGPKARAAVPALVGALTHASPNTRWSAARALGTCGDRRAFAPLRRALRDPGRCATPTTGSGPGRRSPSESSAPGRAGPSSCSG